MFLFMCLNLPPIYFNFGHLSFLFIILSACIVCKGNVTVNPDRGECLKKLEIEMCTQFLFLL